MKSIFFSLIFCVSLQVLAQDVPNSKSLKIELQTIRSNKGVVIEAIEIPFIKKEVDLLGIKTKIKTIDKNSIDIKADYWDTTLHNPYVDTNQEFPLELKFTDTTYASPVPHTKVVTSRYGWRRGRPHNGIDIDLVTGDSVVSVLDGIVRFARYANGFGNTIVVRHYNGLESTYAHLSYIAVKANDTIAKGEYIGKGGNTGNSRGSHLHLELSYKGESIHPEYLFDFSSKNTIRSQNVWVTQKWTHARFHNSKRISKVKVIRSADEAALLNLTKRPKFHVVQKGDTLYGISRRNNLSVAKLCKTNGITQSSPLKIGQKLVLEL
ncbi:MAG: peptidoglycan DD-metalloendopeptidase family protein [Winogradskyella sp.]|uniref:peptidoglycan DD-metalloendopeptidase family protein n=1 Tax=Winogradskyella sp. TaxID=1883156 RepID=UPI00385D28F6